MMAVCNRKAVCTSKGATRSQEALKNKPGKTKAIKHFIHTTDIKSVKQRPYRLPHAYWEEVKQELKDMLVEGVIEPSKVTGHSH